MTPDVERELRERIEKLEAEVARLVAEKADKQELPFDPFNLRGGRTLEAIPIVTPYLGATISNTSH